MHLLSVDQQLAATVVAKQVTDAVNSRNTESLLLIVPSNDEAKPNSGSLHFANVIGAFSAFMQKDFEAFVWAMATIARRRGYEEFLAMYWIAQAQRRDIEV